ncbi:MAG: L,D-transpeptidase family protein [bacterium]|nr:L,D-transpeptidase family protein [bacterium]
MKVYKYAYFLLIIAVSQIVACHSSDKKTNNPTVYADFDPEKLTAAMHQVIDSLKMDTTRTHYYDTLSVFYSSRNYEYIWLKKAKDSMFQVGVFNMWDSVPFEGLKTAHYDCAELKMRMEKLKKIKEVHLYYELAILEIKLSNSMLLLWHDKVLGRTNPQEVLGAKYTLPYPNKALNLFAVLNVDSVLPKVSHYYPAHPDYWKLKKLLAQRFGETEGSETFIDTVGIRKVKPGDTTYIAPMLARRLVELGMAPDSLIHSTDSSFVYKKTTAIYVKEFQRISNVTDDGIIGKSTLKLLNASKNDKLNEIRANIERIRWFSDAPPKPYVMVNIPEFMLYLVYTDSLMAIYKDSLLPVKVCIGQGKEKYFEQRLLRYTKTGRYSDKPQNHETPQIYSTIDYVILNPTWTVPSSIVGREMYSKIVRDPGYLIRNGYQVFDKNVPVNPYNINWRSYSPGNIPYTIRQDAGDDNSLGKIKFTFKNPFSVYLHDTPLKSKFKLNNRAVSHGCVRVENPIDLAGFILQNNQKLNYDDMLIKVGRAPVNDTARARKWREDTTSYKKIVKGTYPIRLENKMVVFFDYKTIVFNEAGQPRFIYDVYDKNKLIVEALDKP